MNRIHRAVTNLQVNYWRGFRACRNWEDYHRLDWFYGYGKRRNDGFRQNFSVSGIDRRPALGGEYSWNFWGISISFSGRPAAVTLFLH